jgi:hypothetical protein
VGTRTLIACAVAGAVGVAAAIRLTTLSPGVTLALVGGVAAVLALPFFVRAILGLDAESESAGPFADAVAALTTPASVSPKRPSDLLALTRNGYDLNVHFRPFVTGVVRDLLAVRARVDLVHDPARARALLGPELRELVWPARDVARNYSDPGLDAARLGRLLDELEQLERIT